MRREPFDFDGQDFFSRVAEALDQSREPGTSDPIEPVVLPEQLLRGLADIERRLRDLERNHPQLRG